MDLFDIIDGIRDCIFYGIDGVQEFFDSKRYLF
jgi:hypothetical protein